MHSVDEMRARHALRWWHLALLVVVCGLPFVKGTVLFTAPYGDSHDGRNGSIWAAGAESLREDPLGSRLGAERPDGRVYATHPPGILTSLATAEMVAGVRPVTDRAVILLGTIASIPLAFVLLLAIRFRPLIALLGVAAMATSPMIRSYGSMVDTPMLAFPIAVTVVLVAVRLDGRPRLRWWEAGVFALAPLLSWQLVLLSAMVIVGTALDARRRRHLFPIMAATAVGCALTAAWLIWANGGAGPVVDQWLARSSIDSQVGLRTAVDTQWFAALQLLGPLMLVLPVLAVIGFRPGRRRWAAGLSLGVVVLYCLLLPNGAAFHDYWSYWVLLPVAIGTAGLGELVLRATRAREYPVAVRAAATTSLLAVLVLPGLLRPSLIEDVNVSSAPVADVIDDAHLPDGQDRLWALAEFRLGDQWLNDLRVPVVHLTEDGYRRLVRADRGDDVVIVSTSPACSVGLVGV